MKNFSNESGRNGKGQILPLVLCFLALGGLTITMLLNFMGTGLKTGQLYEERAKLRYAADAGLEDVLWKMHNEQVPFEPGDYETEFNYALSDNINGKAVTVNMTQIWPLTGLESDEHGTTAPSSLTITGGIIDRGEGKYKVQVSYDGTQGGLPIDKIAVWLPARFEYVAGSSSGISTQNPTITNQRGGKVLTWNLSPAVNFLNLPNPAPPGGGFLPGTEYPATRKLYFNVTPVDDVAGGSYPWVRTTQTSLYLAWETGCTIFQVRSTATDNITGKSVTLGSQTYISEGASLGEGGFQIRGGYRAIGNTLMEDNGSYDWHGHWTDDPDYIRETLLSDSSATITAIPADAEVVLAYLYWSAWWENDYADTEVSFQVDSGNVTAVTASKYSILEAANNYSYASFADVTPLVSGISAGSDHIITVGGVSGLTEEHWSYAGWSLIIFYSSPSELAHQFFLYDQFLYADSSYDDHTFVIEGFEAPEDAEAFLTCFVGEGDDWLNGDYIKFNNYQLSDAVNPANDVWNGKSSGLGGQFIDGVDIDSFNVSSPIIDPGDTSAQVHLHTNTDAWNLVYIILAFRSEYGGLTPNATGIVSYTYGGP